jgi:serine/threonine-protein kinase
LAQIGSGGMAVVYKAEQPSLGRLVAIKELRTELANDESIIARFEREAMAMAALGHQNIAHVYDFVQRASSMYIVMEYVEGIDLYTLLKRTERLPADIAAIVSLQAANALTYAHYRGVIHRDLKPSNLMITKEGDLKLMDFGIARDESQADLTLPGQALGTPAYMSPEQILGEKIDFRSDIFSFGIVMYQMLTGLKPFVEDETIGVMHRIINKPYRPPRSVYPDIPWRLQRIVKRCMQKRPDDRFQDTEDLRHALEGYVSKRVRLNPSGRLLLYLRNRELISDDEAMTFVRREDLESVEIVTADSGAVNGWSVVFKPALIANLIILVFMMAWIAGVELLHPAAHYGYLRVNAHPWAEVWVDGALHDTTPFAAPIPLPPGKHTIEFKNNRIGKSITRLVDVAEGQSQKLDVDLSR